MSFFIFDGYKHANKPEYPDIYILRYHKYAYLSVTSANSMNQ